MDKALTAVTVAEKARIDAILSDDIDRLAALLDESLRFVHSNGRLEDRTQVLRHFREKVRFLELESRDLEVTPYADLVVLTALTRNHVQVRATMDVVTFAAQVVQIWVPRTAGWRLRFYQATRLPA